MKREREYHSCGKEYNMEKRERGSNIIFPIILRLLGRISSGEKGRKRKFWGRKSRFNKRSGKNIKVQGTLYTPAYQCCEWIEEEVGPLQDIQRLVAQERDVDVISYKDMIH